MSPEPPASGGAAPPDGTGGAHVFVADLAHPELEAPDEHHLRRVLRLGSGDALTASDGAGCWRRCRLGPGAALSTAGPIHAVPEEVPELTVAFALVKGSRPELVVQKLTELGIDRIVPFPAQRSVVRWDPGRGEQRLERWRRVAREAAMQSRRVRLARIEDLTPLGGLEAWGSVALAAPDGEPPSLAHTVVAIGPEGGWDPDELALGHPRVALGAQVLRAETAAITAAALLTALRRGLVAPAG